MYRFKGILRWISVNSHEFKLEVVKILGVVTELCVWLMASLFVHKGRPAVNQDTCAR